MTTAGQMVVRLNLMVCLLLIGASCAHRQAGAPLEPVSSRESAAAEARPLRLMVELADGSRLLGMPVVKSLAVRTPYAKLEIAFDQVRRVTIAPDRETVVIEMDNGDRIHGALILKILEIETAFGKVSIGAEQIKEVRVAGFWDWRPELRAGLILHYTFDGEDNGRAADASGHGNHGKICGTAWTPAGKVGGARVFNGTGDCIVVDHDEKTGLFPTGAPLSVAAWFKTSAEAPKHQPVLSTHYNGAGRDGYHLRVDSRDHGGRVYWVASVEGGAYAVSQRAVNDGEWHHVAGVWDGKQNSLYLDGVLQAAAPASGSLVYSHRAPFQVGHAANNNAPHARDEFYYFKGTLDEIMVFARALSAEDAQALYRAGQ